MFMAADIVVKAVMIGLVFASVLTWTIWFAKAIELMVRARPHARGASSAQRRPLVARGRAACKDAAQRRAAL